MSEMREIIVDTTRRIFTDLGAPQEVILAGDDGWKAPLWAALEEAGLTQAWVGEDEGGAGLSVTDTFAILRVAGRFAVGVPLAETLLAAKALGDAGLPVPPGAIALALPVSADRPLLAAGMLQGEVAGVASLRSANISSCWPTAPRARRSRSPPSPTARFGRSRASRARPLPTLRSPRRPSWRAPRRACAKRG